MKSYQKLKTKRSKKMKFYKIKDIQEMFDVSYLTVRSWIETGKLKAFKIGRTIRITEEDLQNFVKSNTNSESLINKITNKIKEET